MPVAGLDLVSSLIDTQARSMGSDMHLQLCAEPAGTLLIDWLISHTLTYPFHSYIAVSDDYLAFPCR